MNLKRQQACQALKAGKLLAYPTEAVFGLGCLAKNIPALKKLRKIKRRATHKGFIVLCTSTDQLLMHFPKIKLSHDQLKQINTKQKHPTTWIVPATNALGIYKKLLAGNNHTLAIRICEHPSVYDICQSVGPIVSSSANIAGAVPARNLLQVRKQFRKQINVYLNEPLGKAKSPSQIIDLQSGEILRRA